MASEYVVVQYVPDPVIDERVNVGVIVFGQGVLLSRFLNRWKRVATFGGEHIEFLKAFAKSVQPDGRSLRMAMPGGDWGDRIDEDILRQIAGRWINSIQFTPPRASILEAEQLLEEIAARFLRQPTQGEPRIRDKRTAASIAARSLREAITDRLGHVPRDVIERNYLVHGAVDQHRFDVFLSAGVQSVAVQGLSFEVPDVRQLTEQYQVAAWAVEDVKKGNAELELPIVVLPPTRNVPVFELAKGVLETVGAVLVSEADVRTWAEGLATRVHAHS